MNHSHPDKPATSAASGGASHSIAVLVYDGVKILDVAGPVEVFAEANRFGANYRVSLVSPTGADITTSLGIRMAVDDDAKLQQPPDTFLVAGSDMYPSTAVPPDLIAAAQTASVGAKRVASICTGAFILAAAGLLDGKRATTHWKVAHTLASRYPNTQVEPDAIYVRDGTTYTSAGVTAGIDLALALVEEDHGPDLTREVARSLVVYLQRAGGQSQFSAPLQGSPPRTPALRSILDLVAADPSATHSVTELADHLNLSPRHLTRLFHDELSTTPARYVESIRLDMAKSFLDQGFTATQAAERAGFPSYESLRRVFARELEISPATYQRQFRTSRRAEPAEKHAAS